MGPHFNKVCLSYLNLMPPLDYSFGDVRPLVMDMIRRLLIIYQVCL